MSATDDTCEWEVLPLDGRAVKPSCGYVTNERDVTRVDTRHNLICPGCGLRVELVRDRYKGGIGHDLAVSIATAILSEAGCRPSIEAAFDRCHINERLEIIETWACIIERGVHPAFRARELMRTGMGTLVDRIDELEAENNKLTEQAMLDQVTIQNFEIASQSQRASEHE